MSHYAPHIPAARGQPPGSRLKLWQAVLLSAAGLATLAALALATWQLGAVIFFALK